MLRKEFHQELNAKLLKESKQEESTVSQEQEWLRRRELERLKQLQTLLLKENLEICDFIEKNIDFFTAPFRQTEKFEKYLNYKFKNLPGTLKESFELFSKTFNDMMLEQALTNGGSSINSVKNDYLTALLGFGTNNKGAIRGEKLTLKHFFDQNSKIRNFFFITKDSLNGFIEKWQEYNQILKEQLSKEQNIDEQKTEDKLQLGS